FRVSNPSTAGTVAITTHTGLDIADLTLGTTKRSIISRGSAIPMLHAGPVRIGDLTTPTDKLEVAGAVYAQDAALTSIAAATSFFGSRKNMTVTTDPAAVILRVLDVSGTWSYSVDSFSPTVTLYDHQKVTL